MYTIEKQLKKFNIILFLKLCYKIVKMNVES